MFIFIWIEKLLFYVGVLPHFQPLSDFQETAASKIDSTVDKSRETSTSNSNSMEKGEISELLTLSYLTGKNYERFQ